MEKGHVSVMIYNGSCLEKLLQSQYLVCSLHLRSVSSSPRVDTKQDDQLHISQFWCWSAHAALICRGLILNIVPWRDWPKFLWRGCVCALRPPPPFAGGRAPTLLHAPSTLKEVPCLPCTALVPGSAGFAHDAGEDTWQQSAKRTFGTILPLLYNLDVARATQGCLILNLT